MRSLPAVAASVVLALLLGGGVRRWLGLMAEVESDSMTPTLVAGQRVLVRRQASARPLRRGDVVVVDAAGIGRPVIKRVVGLPGERVEVLEDGRVLVEGRVLQEPYVLHRGGRPRSLYVPPGHVVLLGGNRARSSDSRTWGEPYVPVSAVLGRVVRPTRPPQRSVISA